MDSLSNNIFSYYRAHFSELSFDKQLHFSSRLKLWTDDPFAAEMLETLRPQATANENPKQVLGDVYQTMLDTPLSGLENAGAIRAPYFAKYPNLRAINALLFRATFLQTVFGIDARHEVYEIVSEAELRSLATELLEDTGALTALSTYAVNFLYLYSRNFAHDDTLFDPKIFIETVARGYDFSDYSHIQLYNYLSTHCVLGETLFYARPLPEKYAVTYMQMMQELGKVLNDHYDEINLDNKFEYLVCCKIVGLESPLAAKIEAEAEKSISPDGTFLIDTHNKHPQTTKTNLELSEHRNVLYIMAHRAFTA